MDRRLGTERIRRSGMRYFKKIENGYIIAIGTGGGGTKISKSSYDEIMSIIQNKPPRTETTDFRLKKDLTWEEYERPIDPADDEIDAEEALDILLGRDGDEETESA